MKIGEIVEVLIQMRDNYDLTKTNDDAVCAACNILNRLPVMMNEEIAKDTLRQFNIVIDI